MSSSESVLLDIRVHRNQSNEIPSHHVTAITTQSWSSYLTNWSLSSNEPPVKKVGSLSSFRDRNASTVSQTSDKHERIGFKNPWPSWYKPTRKQVWDALEWGDDQDTCIELAASHVRTPTTLQSLQPSRAQLAARTLKVQKPDFDFNPLENRAKTTWLGHAGVLVQLPPLKSGGSPLRCIFDPIFSTRSSPTQVAGPIRSYPPPCGIESLPPIDIFMMSHNHHDHLDYDTVMALWKLNRDWIRFLVPLGNKAWFVECGIDEQRVTELDWWEAADIYESGQTPVKITCTPSQHNSGRTGLDKDATLWSSWYLEYPSADPYRVYFAGDTGYQFHDSSEWPPEPLMTNRKFDLQKKDFEERNPYPECPAFQEIADRLGSPDLLLLPVAVGATFSFLRSYVPLPDSMSPFPRHRLGITAANHMPPWDAVRAYNVMTSKFNRQDGQRPVAIAMHWGTFVPERTEVLKTLGQLEYACSQQNVRFARSMEDVKDEDAESIFLALNHGQSVLT